MKILLEIEVPEGKYCWRYRDTVCDFFDKENLRCEVGLTSGYSPARVSDGYRKPATCIGLPEVKGENESLARD